MELIHHHLTSRDFRCHIPFPVKGAVCNSTTYCKPLWFPFQISKAFPPDNFSCVHVCLHNPVDFVVIAQPLRGKSFHRNGTYRAPAVFPWNLDAFYYLIFFSIKKNGTGIFLFSGKSKDCLIAGNLHAKFFISSFCQPMFHSVKPPFSHSMLIITRFSPACISVFIFPTVHSQESVIE